MNYEEVEILFVEDSIDDAILTIRALTKSGFTNKLLHVKDGAEALDFISIGIVYFSEKNSFISFNAVAHIKSSNTIQFLL